MTIYEYLTEIEKDTSTKLDKLSKSSGQAETSVNLLNSAFGGLSGVVSDLNIGANLSSAGKAAFDLGVNMEQAKFSFAAVLKDADLANKTVEELNKFSDATPFNTDVVLDAGKSLLSYGVTANEIPKTLAKIGDISAGTGTDLKVLSNLYGAAQKAGTLHAKELSKFEDAGIPILKQYADSLGISKKEAEKMAAAGKIQFKDLENAFTALTSEGGQFYDMTGKLSDTVGGQMSILEGKVMGIGASIGEAFLPIINDIFGRLIVLIDENKDQIIAWTESAVQHVQAFVNGIIDLWHWMQENSSTIEALGLVAGIVFAAFVGYQSVLGILAIQAGFLATKLALVNFLMNLNPVGLVVAAVAALIAIITIAIIKYDEWGAALLLVMGPITTIVNLVMSFVRHWDSIKQAFEDGGIVAGLKRIGLVMLDALLMPMQQLLEIASNLPGDLGAFASSGADGIDEIRKSLELVPETVEKTEKAINPSQKPSPLIDQEVTGGSFDAITRSLGLTSSPLQASSLAIDQEGKLVESISDNEEASATASGNSLSSELKSGVNSINTNSSTNNSDVNITIGNLIGEQTINVANGEEAAEDITATVEEALIRVLNSANQTATQ